MYFIFILCPVFALSIQEMNILDRKCAMMQLQLWSTTDNILNKEKATQIEYLIFAVSLQGTISLNCFQLWGALAFLMCCILGQYCTNNLVSMLTYWQCIQCERSTKSKPWFKYICRKELGHIFTSSNTEFLLSPLNNHSQAYRKDQKNPNTFSPSLQSKHPLL